MATLIGHNEQQNAAGNSITFTVPAGVQAGDIILVGVIFGTNNAPTTIDGTLTGLTADWNVGNPQGAGGRNSWIYVAHKPAVGNESGQTLRFISFAAPLCGELFVVRDLTVSSFTPTIFTTTAINTSGTSSFSASMSQSPAGNHLAATFGFYNANGTYGGGPFTGTESMPAAYTGTGGTWASAIPAVSAVGGYASFSSGAQVGGSWTAGTGGSPTTTDTDIAIVLLFPTNTAPTCSIVGPADGLVTATPPNVNITFTDPDTGQTDTAILQISTDPTFATGVTTLSQSGTGPFSGFAYTFNLPFNLPPGRNYYRLHATDSAGGDSGWTATRSFYLDPVS